MTNSSILTVCNPHPGRLVCFPLASPVQGEVSRRQVTRRGWGIVMLRYMTFDYSVSAKGNLRRGGAPCVKLLGTAGGTGNPSPTARNPSVSACAETAHLRPNSRLMAVGLRNTPAGVAFAQGSHGFTAPAHSKTHHVTVKSFFEVMTGAGNARARFIYLGSLMSVQLLTSHWPYEFRPTATTVPSDFRPTV